MTSLRSRIASGRSAPACIWRDQPRTSEELLRASDAFGEAFASVGIASGDVVAVIGDYSPNMIAAHLTLLDLGAISVPLPPSLHASDRDRKVELAHTTHVVWVADDDNWGLESGPGGKRSELVDILVDRGHPGFVVFTSGTTGEPKAVLHDFTQ